MEVITCKHCGRPFNYLAGDKLCPTCSKIIEELFQKVKVFLDENPGANIPTIMEETGVKKSQLQKWILQERLILTEASPIAMTCENCGKKIYTGKLCADCKEKVADGFSAINDANNAKIKKREEEAAQLAEIRRKGKMNFVNHS